MASRSRINGFLASRIMAGLVAASWLRRIRAVDAGQSVAAEQVCVFVILSPVSAAGLSRGGGWVRSVGAGFCKSPSAVLAEPSTGMLLGHWVLDRVRRCRLILEATQLLWDGCHLATAGLCRGWLLADRSVPRNGLDLCRTCDGWLESFAPLVTPGWHCKS